jgi:hypothetical protein
LFNKEKAQLCPGGVCETPSAQVQSTRLAQIVIVAAFLLTIAGIAQWVYSTAPKRQAELSRLSVTEPGAPVDPAEVERCKVPDFAKALGHEAMWKLHNNCK